MVGSGAILSSMAGLAAIALGYAAIQARRNDRWIPAADNATLPAGTVSVIIPARDEQENLRELLPTLLTQTYRPAEIIVVDDASTDRTAEVAREYGARVLRVSHLPTGWTGKSHACHIGAEHAEGEWLLFVDADVRLEPSAVARALAYAEHQGLSVLSAMLRQECGSPIERLMLPFAYAQYFAGAPVAAHFDSPRREAILNGQFVLCKQDVYIDTGGMAAVRGAVMEDLALGRLLKQKGVQVGLIHGEAFGRVRMHRSLNRIWRGFSKTALTSLSYNPRGGLVTIAAQIASSIVLPLVLSAALLRTPTAFVLSILAYLIGTVHVAYWSRRYQVSPSYSLLHPIAALVMMAIALPAILRRALGHGVEWKGRTIVSTDG